MTKHRILGLLAAGFISLFSAPSFAAQMLVLEQPGCPYCAKFEKEIAPIWDKTDEGKKAELRRVDITQDWPEDINSIEKSRLTPTFVLIEDGKELGRLRGYPGDQYFWYLIDELLAKLPEKPAEENGVAAETPTTQPAPAAIPDAAPANGQG